MRINHYLFTALLLGAALLNVDTALSQSPEHPGRDGSEARVSPNAFVAQTVGTNEISVAYGRPSVKGRDVFGDLVPYGQVWRTGANEATTIVFPTDVLVEGEELPAGVYALFTVPGEESWTYVFNSQAKQWGAFRHDADLDVLRVDVQPEEAGHAEHLTFNFKNVSEDSATLVLHWDETKVPLEINITE